MKSLICASNYSGSWQLYQSINDALKIKNLLITYYLQSEQDITILLNQQYKKSNTILELHNIADYLKHQYKVALIYVAGHGDQIRDNNGDESDGKDEVWKTHFRETITDDEITDIFIGIHSTSYLIVISDTCSSGTILDLEKFKTNENIITISSCQDYQDSLQTGDGSVMTFCLLEILKQKPITFRELKQNLRIRMSNFIGDLQTELVQSSNENLWDLYFFESIIS